MVSKTNNISEAQRQQARFKRRIAGLKTKLRFENDPHERRLIKKGIESFTNRINDLQTQISRGRITDPDVRALAEKRTHTKSRVPKESLSARSTRRRPRPTQQQELQSGRIEVTTKPKVRPQQNPNQPTQPLQPKVIDQAPTIFVSTDDSNADLRKAEVQGRFAEKAFAKNVILAEKLDQKAEQQLREGRTGASLLTRGAALGVGAAEVITGTAAFAQVVVTDPKRAFTGVKQVVKDPLAAGAQFGQTLRQSPARGLGVLGAEIAGPKGLGKVKSGVVRTLGKESKAFKLDPKVVSGQEIFTTPDPSDTLKSTLKEFRGSKVEGKIVLTSATTTPFGKKTDIGTGKSSEPGLFVSTAERVSPFFFERRPLASGDRGRFGQQIPSLTLKPKLFDRPRTLGIEVTGVEAIPRRELRAGESASNRFLIERAAAEQPGKAFISGEFTRFLEKIPGKSKREFEAIIPPGTQVTRQTPKTAGGKILGFDEFIEVTGVGPVGVQRLKVTGVKATGKTDTLGTATRRSERSLRRSVSVSDELTRIGRRSRSTGISRGARGRSSSAARPRRTAPPLRRDVPDVRRNSQPRRPATTRRPPTTRRVPDPRRPVDPRRPRDTTRPFDPRRPPRTPTTTTVRIPRTPPPITAKLPSLSQDSKQKFQLGRARRTFAPSLIGVQQRVRETTTKGQAVSGLTGRGVRRKKKPKKKPSKKKSKKTRRKKQ